jgi:hypothetical protein
MIRSQITADDAAAAVRKLLVEVEKLRSTIWTGGCSTRRCIR